VTVERLAAVNRRERILYLHRNGGCKLGIARQLKVSHQYVAQVIAAEKVRRERRTA
jgi:hypothetical protein